MSHNEWDHTDVVPAGSPGIWAIRGHTRPAGSRDGQIFSLPLSLAELAIVCHQGRQVLAAQQEVTREEESR